MGLETLKGLATAAYNNLPTLDTIKAAPGKALGYAWGHKKGIAAAVVVVALAALYGRSTWTAYKAGAPLAQAVIHPAKWTFALITDNRITNYVLSFFGRA